MARCRAAHSPGADAVQGRGSHGVAPPANHGCGRSPERRSRCYK
ncbi:hypothetical protein FM106_25895 [Brachybacterium faecium]|nr:hypothetical protein FM106_25895 [Brachybacterium faecium]